MRSRPPRWIRFKVEIIGLLLNLDLRKSRFELKKLNFAFQLKFKLESIFAFQLFNRRVWPFRFGSRIGEPSGKSSANLTPFFTPRAPSACPALIPSHPLQSRRLPFLIRVVGGQDPFGGQPRPPRGTQVGTLHPNSPVHSNHLYLLQLSLFSMVPQPLRISGQSLPNFKN